jgi:ribosome maturation factor RimP
MTAKTHFVVNQVAELVEPILDEMGIELVDVEFLSQSGKWVLRLYIDKEAGVTIDDCVRVSREIGDLIDVKEAVTHEYTLEVSSPGIDRPLRKEKDFVGAIGKKVKVRMITPIDGRRSFTGYLKGFENDTLYIDIDGSSVTLPWAEVEKANLIYEFD